MNEIKNTDDKVKIFDEPTIQISLDVPKSARLTCRQKDVSYKHVFMLGLASLTENPGYIERIGALERENKARMLEFYALRRRFNELEQELEKQTAEVGR